MRIILFLTLFYGVSSSAYFKQYNFVLDKMQRVYLDYDEEVDLGDQVEKDQASIWDSQLKRALKEDLDQALKKLLSTLTMKKASFIYPYNVNFTSSSEANAYGLPNGSIYFNKGLVDLFTFDGVVKTKLLIGVLAHEIAHVVSRHTNRTLYMFPQLRDAIGDESKILKIRFPNRRRKINFISRVLSSYRKNELEADRIGALLLEEAGFEASYLIEALKIMRQDKKDPNYFEVLQSTHPSIKKRIKKMKEQ